MENLPVEFREARRFFPVRLVESGGKLEKVPCINGWTHAENLMTAEEAAKTTGLVSFLISGVGVDVYYLLLDFDNVLGDAGEFVNAEAERVFLDVINSFQKCYVERSIGGRGLHIFALPTPGMFSAVSNTEGKGILYFDKSRKSKLEIFYKTGGRHCLVTGNLFECKVGAVVPDGEAVDELFSSLLRQIERQAEDMGIKVAADYADAVIDSGQSTEERERDIFRAKEMLRVLSRVNHKDMTYNEWLKINTSCKNIGLSFDYVDAHFNAAPGNGNQHDRKKNWAHWKTLGRGKYASMGIRTLHTIAKKFGYSERAATFEYHNRYLDVENKPRAKIIPFAVDEHDDKDSGASSVEKLFGACREKFSLKDFVEKCGGTWRGLTYETLAEKNCVYHGAFEIDSGFCRPCILIPQDVTLKADSFVWLRVDEVPEGEMKGGVPKDSKRKPYIVAPISLDFPNFIVEGEVDALSIAQVWPYSGVVATGGVNFTRHLVAYLKNQFGTAERKPLFVVLFDNDKAGKTEGEKLTLALNAAGFLTEQDFLSPFVKGEPLPSVDGVLMEAKKIDANDLLQQGEIELFDRLYQIFGTAGNLLELRAEALGRKTPWQKTNGAH